MPAAAVIPAPIAYIKVVAVKKLVVELPRAHAVCLTASTVWVRAPLVVSLDAVCSVSW